MIKIAIYGKGGIGKSTTVSNLSAALADRGLRVMQIGCDPKADSTVNLLHGERVNTALDLIRRHGNNFTLDDMVRTGYGGVICAGFADKESAYTAMDKLSDAIRSQENYANIVYEF